MTKPIVAFRHSAQRTSPIILFSSGGVCCMVKEDVSDMCVDVADSKNL